MLRVRNIRLVLLPMLYVEPMEVEEVVVVVDCKYPSRKIIVRMVIVLCLLPKILVHTISVLLHGMEKG